MIMQRSLGAVLIHPRIDAGPERHQELHAASYGYNRLRQSIGCTELQSKENASLECGNIVEQGSYSCTSLLLQQR